MIYDQFNRPISKRAIGFRSRAAVVPAAAVDKSRLKELPIMEVVEERGVTAPRRLKTEGLRSKVDATGV